MGEAERALADFGKMLAECPDDIPCLEQRAALLRAQGRSKEALEDFSRLIRLRPSDPTNLLNRGQMYAALGQYDAARKDIEAAMQAGALVDGLCERGGLAVRQGQVAQASADFEQALRLDARCGRAYLGRGKLRQVQGRWTEARADFDAALRLLPDLPYAWADRACLLVYMRCYGEAADDYSRALQLLPRSGRFLADRAVCRLALGLLDPASSDLDEATRLAPRGPPCRDPGPDPGGQGQGEDEAWRDLKDEAGVGTSARVVAHAHRAGACAGPRRGVRTGRDGALWGRPVCGGKPVRSPVQPFPGAPGGEGCVPDAEEEAAADGLAREREWPGPLLLHLLGRMSEQDMEREIVVDAATRRPLVALAKALEECAAGRREVAVRVLRGALSAPGVRLCPEYSLLRMAERRLETARGGKG